jgi:phytoene/squalene synthetase
MNEHEENLALAVRAADYERFLAAQLAPAAKRPALYALTALNTELARIAETVSEPLLGHIRLAWWREALEEIAAGAAPRNHPVMLALAEVTRAQPRALGECLKMVEARAADLDESLLAEEEAWLAYLDGTAGALHRAWALVLDEVAASTHASAIADTARAYAVIGLARAIPYLHAQGFLRFPAERVAAARLTSLASSGELEAFVSQLVGDIAPSMLTKYSWPKSLAPLRVFASFNHIHQKAIYACFYNVYKIRHPRLSLVLHALQVKFF